MTRSVCYVTGTRADFGLMRGVLEGAHAHHDLELSIIVTGTHLLARYGATVREIEGLGLPIAARVEVNMEPPTGETMARNIGEMLSAIAGILAGLKPDVVLLLGDRGEMLAGALAAIHLNIPVVHIHGGERSGTVDEPVRHAISKLAHFHLVATPEARKRLIRMGELAQRVTVTGAPGLDGIESLAVHDRDELTREIGLDSAKPIALMLYHPVLQEAEMAGEGASLILDTLRRLNVQVVALRPNADAASDQIQSVLDRNGRFSDIRVVTHFSRTVFCSWMAAADLMVGNSSAGIIEAASFGLPVVNVGSRQALRERNQNVIDVEVRGEALENAIKRALKLGRFNRRNIYGDGKAVARIVEFLASVKLDAAILRKINAY